MLPTLTSLSTLPFFAVLAEMDRVGCDMCVDVHGDEALPYNFLSGSEGLPIWGDRLKHLQDTFSDAFKKVSIVYVCIYVCIVYVNICSLL